QFVTVQLQEPPFADFAVVHGTALRASQPVPEDIIRIIEVFLEIAPGSTMELAAIHPKQLEPRILFSKIAIARHHCGERAQSKSIPAEARSDKLLAVVFSDEWQAVIGFDD